MRIGDLKQKISKWYHGEWYKNKPDDDIPYFGRVYQPSAIRVRRAVDYVKKEHKFLIGTILTIVGLTVVILTL